MLYSGNVLVCSSKTTKVKRIKEMEYIDVYDAQKRKTGAIKVRGD